MEVTQNVFFTTKWLNVPVGMDILVIRYLLVDVKTLMNVTIIHVLVELYVKIYRDDFNVNVPAASVETLTWMVAYLVKFQMNVAIPIPALKANSVFCTKENMFVFVLKDSHVIKKLAYVKILMSAHNMDAHLVV